MSDDAQEPTADEPVGDIEPEGAAADEAVDETPTDEVEKPVEPTCGECSSPIEPSQAYCLTCGAPTENAPRATLGARSTGLLAAGLIAAGLGAGAIGFAVATDEGPGAQAGVFTDATTAPVAPVTGTPTPPPVTTPTPTVATETALPTASTLSVTTAPVVTTPSTSASTTSDAIPEVTISTTGTLPAVGTTGTTSTGTTSTATTSTATTSTPTTSTASTSTATTSTATTSTPTTSTASTSAAGSDDWPKGRTAWTAIIQSTTSRPEADATKGKVKAAGQSVGVLRSSNYSSLKNGFYVVFSGTYSSRSQADAQVKALASKFPKSYVRQVVP